MTDSKIPGPTGPYRIAQTRLNDESEVIQIIRCHGYDFGKTINVKSRRGQYAVAHRPGHTAWAGVAMRRWVDSEWWLIEFHMDQENNLSFTILERYTPGHQWRFTKDHLTTEMKRLYSNFCREG